MASDRGEVDTSRAFRSVKEAVAVFGERILVREAQLRANGGAHGGCRVGKEFNSRVNAVAIAASDVKLPNRSDGVMESHSNSKPSVVNVTCNAKEEQSSGSSKPAAPSLPPVPVPRPPVAEDVPMYLVPSSPPFFASSPSLANDDGDDDEQERKAADLVVISAIRRLEDEAARTRQEVARLKRRLAEMELSMATLNAKLHRALSKVAHMEADNAAAARASIGRDMAAALAVSAERPRRAPTSRPQLGHLLRLGVGEQADREALALVSGSGSDGGWAVAPARRKAQKQKPIVPLVVPLVNDVLFSKKRRTKDKESVYMKELYSLLRLS